MYNQIQYQIEIRYAFSRRTKKEEGGRRKEEEEKRRSNNCHFRKPNVILDHCV